MRFTWNEEKRLRNRRVHGLDFADAHKVFADGGLCFEDDRFIYSEQRNGDPLRHVRTVI